MAFVVTKQHLKLLKPSATENYITELVNHCDKNYSHLKETMGEPKLRETLRGCIDKAECSGFTQRGPVRFYIELMIVLGAEFETDPQYTWLLESWYKNKKFSELIQACELQKDVEIYLKNITGENSCYLFSVANKLEVLELNSLSITRKSHIEDMHSLLNIVFPQKYQLTPKDDMTTLVEQGIAKAHYDYGFTKANHAFLIVLLRFLLGHQFDHNPFYDWASIDRTFKNQEVLDNIEKEAIVERLATRAKIWLSAAIKREKQLLSNQGIEAYQV